MVQKALNIVTACFIEPKPQRVKTRSSREVSKRHATRSDPKVEPRPIARVASRTTIVEESTIEEAIEAEMRTRGEPDGDYELNPLMTRAVEAELEDIMIKIWQALPDDPMHDAENVVVDKLRNAAGDDLRNVLGLNVSKRLLNVYNPLFVKIQFSGKPERAHLKNFLRKYNFTAFKRIGKVDLFAAQMRTINDFDRICADKNISCGDVKVTVNPSYRFTKCPSNLKSIFDDSSQDNDKETRNKEPVDKLQDKQDKRIDNAEATHDKTKSTPKKTQPTPQSTANKTQSTANKTETSANKTQSTANKTETSANKIQSTANKTETSANKTQTTANKTQSTANKTETTANKTEITANKTQITANKIQSTANKTQTTANKTETTNNKTQSTANETQTTVNKTQPTANKTQSTANKTQSTANKTQQATNKTQSTADKTKPISNKPQSTVNKTKPVASQTQPVVNKTQTTPNKTQPIKTDQIEVSQNIAKSKTIKSETDATQKSMHSPQKNQSVSKTVNIKVETKPAAVVVKPTATESNTANVVSKPNTSQTIPNKKVITPPKPNSTTAKQTSTTTEIKKEVPTTEQKVVETKIDANISKGRIESRVTGNEDKSVNAPSSELSDMDEVDDDYILALISEGIVLDECSGSDDE